nr:CRISPR-associated helicase Cas3' [Candidatus Freyarchaeota archaeon]
MESLLSHPDKRLCEHLQNVANGIYYGLSELNLKLDFDKQTLCELGYIIGISHDFGKATKHFQEYILSDKETKKKLKSRAENRHSSVSALFSLYLAEKYSSKQDLKEESKLFLALAAYLVVRRHHGDLGSAEGDLNDLRLHSDEYIKKVDDMDKDEVEHLFNLLISQRIQTIRVSLEEFKDWQKSFTSGESRFRYNKVLRSVERQKKLDFFFLINLLYSHLIDADKKDAAGLEFSSPRYDLPADLIDVFKAEKFGRENTSKKIDEFREEIYNTVTNLVNYVNPKENRIFTVEAFTGSGKTLTALSFALKLRDKIIREMNIRPRIIYSLPFLSIIDQNSGVIEEVFNSNRLPLSDLFMKHHHLADIDYKVDDEMMQLPLDIDKALLFVESWTSEIVITTFVQLFHSLITNRNRALKKFHNIANSIIILDEIQAIPYKYWAVIHDTLSLLAEKYNIWIIQMTATMPLIFNPESVTNLVENNEYYHSQLNRIKMEVNLEEKKLPEFRESLLQDILNNPEKDFLIILNTINSSKDVFDFLKHNLPQESAELFYLSSSVAPVERYPRIIKMKKRNDGEKRKQKIMVSTQVVEAGVDLSVDIVYRDLAPLDSLVQSAGRCNRNANQSIGTVKIINLVDEKTDREFHNYIYDRFLINKTVSALSKFHSLNEADIYNSMKQYYELVKNFMSEKEAKETLNNLYELNFSRVSEFKLIEENGDNVDVFIELNSEAEQLRQEFEKMNTLTDRKEHRKQWLQIKNRFYQYLISVRTKQPPSLPELGKHIFIVERKNLGEWYDEDTGFGRKITNPI